MSNNDKRLLEDAEQSYDEAATDDPEAAALGLALLSFFFFFFIIAVVLPTLHSLQSLDSARCTLYPRSSPSSSHLRLHLCFQCLFAGLHPPLHCADLDPPRFRTGTLASLSFVKLSPASAILLLRCLREVFPLLGARPNIFSSFAYFFFCASSFWPFALRFTFQVLCEFLGFFMTPKASRPIEVSTGIVVLVARTGGHLTTCGAEHGSETSFATRKEGPHLEYDRKCIADGVEVG